MTTRLALLHLKLFPGPGSAHGVQVKYKKARIARRAQVKQRFVKHREKLQKTGQWAGPRKFEAWLEWLAEREMDNVGEADAAAIPSVSCMPQVMCLSTMCV